MPELKNTSRRDPAAAIGGLIIAFQEVENALILVLASLADCSDDRVGIIIATQLSFQRLGATAEALLHHRTKEVHSFYDWREITNGGITYERMKSRVKAGKGFSPDYEMLDTEKVDDVSDRLRILTAGIDLFFERLQAAKVISDRRSPEG